MFNMSSIEIKKIGITNLTTDVIDHCLKDTSKPVKEKEQARFGKLCAEFGM